MKLLALDTATRHASVAVCEETQVLAEAEQEVTTHSEGLLSLIDGALRRAGLSLSDLDAVVCGRGPGSFTGLRIGLSTAKGLCLAARKPLVCLSSLLPLGAAVAEARSGSDDLVAAILDARRQEVFLGLFRAGCLLEPESLRRPPDLAADLAARDEPVLLAGDGALLYRDLLQSALGERGALAPEGCHAIHARYLALAALPRLRDGEVDDLAEAVPHYLRPSDARLPDPPLRPWLT
jgi:tRNA threonylcarbamoyladenosine biosynthesis protein TsaB